MSGVLTEGLTSRRDGFRGFHVPVSTDGRPEEGRTRWEWEGVVHFTLDRKHGVWENTEIRCPGGLTSDSTSSPKKYLPRVPISSQMESGDQTSNAEGHRGAETQSQSAKEHYGAFELGPGTNLAGTHFSSIPVPAWMVYLKSE